MEQRRERETEFTKRTDYEQLKANDLEIEALEQADQSIEREDVIDALHPTSISLYANCTLGVWAIVRAKLYGKFGKRLGVSVLDQAVRQERTRLRKEAKAREEEEEPAAGPELVDVHEDWEPMLAGIKEAYGSQWFKARDVAGLVRAGDLDLPAGLVGAGLKDGSIERMIGWGLRRRWSDGKLERALDPRTKVALWRFAPEPEPEEIDEAAEQWERFTLELHMEYGDEWFTVKQICDGTTLYPCPFTLPDTLGDIDRRKEGWLENALGRSLRKRTGTSARTEEHEYRLLRRIDPITRGTQYRVVRKPETA